MEIVGTFIYNPEYIMLHWWLREKSFPFDKLVSLIPKTGVMADVGCGFGILVKKILEKNSGLKLILIDASAKKLKVARNIFKNDRRVKIYPATAGVPRLSQKLDCVVIVDVLYLMDEVTKLQWLKNWARKIKPDGKLIVAIVPKEKSWRYWLAWLQEGVMVRGLGLTRSQDQTINFETEIWMKNTFKKLGLKKIRRYLLPTPLPFWHKHVLYSGYVAAKKTD